MPTTTEANFERCDKDADCAIARADCCGCDEGGKARAVAKKGLAAWTSTLSARCKDTLCAQMISPDPTCHQVAACREHRCMLVDGKR